MSHLNSRVTMLLFVQALLLVACSPAGDESTRQSASPPPQGAPVQEVAPPPAPAGAASAAAPDAGQPGAAALREFVDPVTGQRRAPTSAELKAMDNAGRVTPQAVPAPRPRDKEIVFADGTVAVEETAPSQLQACVQKDGKVLVDHDCKPVAPAPVKKP